MRAQETSAKALEQIQERGDDVSLQHQIVANLMEAGPMPRRGLARHMGMEDRWSSLTARVRELLDLGVVYEEGTMEDPETGAQGNVLHASPRAPEFLLGDWNPEPPDEPDRDGVRVSGDLLERMKDCIENPGSLTKWMNLKTAYEEEIQE